MTPIGYTSGTVGSQKMKQIHTKSNLPGNNSNSVLSTFSINRMAQSPATNKILPSSCGIEDNFYKS